MKINIFQMKIFQKITLFLFIISSFVELNVLVSLPKSFMVHLTMRIHCHWPTDHSTDHSSIGINSQLTIDKQSVLNEAWLFTIY